MRIFDSVIAVENVLIYTLRRTMSLENKAKDVVSIGSLKSSKKLKD